MNNDLSGSPEELAQRLRQAILAGDTQETSALLDAPGDHYLIPDHDGWTPLHCACSVGALDTVRRLAEKGADVNCTDAKNAWTPLHYAAAHGHALLVEPLVASGANVNAYSGPQQNTPIHVAAECGSPAVIKALAAHGADGNAANGAGELALHIAVAKGHAECVSELIAGGADKDARGQQRATALHWASSMGNVAMASLLIEKGAQPDLADELGWTPLFLAAHGGNGELVQLFLEAGASTSAVINGQPVSLDVGSAAPGANDRLLSSAHEASLHGVSQALDDSADVNCRTNDGWTALLAGVENVEITRLLLSRGANPNIASDRGYTPLMRAGGKDALPSVRVLLEQGADPLLTDCDGKSAFRLTDEMDNFECAETIANAHAERIIASRTSGSADGTQWVPLDGASRVMISMTRATVGGWVKRLDVTFEDGSALSGANLIDELVLEIPGEYAGRKIAKVSVPLNQG